MSEAEISACLFFNRITRRRLLRRSFAVVSRLGDGIFWYSIIIALPFLYGQSAARVSAHMMIVGLLSLLLYKLIKLSTQRERPFRMNSDILQSVPPLDRFSFPSGHTMHAVGFTIILVSYYPQWAIVVVPFTLLVALSRLVLGLHYPSDVLVGAIIGTTVAVGSLVLF
ncbi:MAG: phosphatase PAP2 family protein [Gammaproteobacteria bacterium]